MVIASAARLKDKVTTIHRVVKIITAHVFDAACSAAMTVIVSDIRVIDARRTSSFINVAEVCRRQRVQCKGIVTL